MDQNSFKTGLCIGDLDTFEWPVDVKVPTNGDYTTHRFTGQFRYISLDETKDLLAGVETPDIDPADPRASLLLAEHTAQIQVDLYMQIWRGWGDDLTGPEDKPLPVNDQAKRQLLSQRIIREAVIEAYRQSQGGEEARLGNSETLPDSGQQEDAATTESTSTS